MVGGLRCVVIRVKSDPNRSRGYGAVGGRKWPFPITLASGLYNSTSRDVQLARELCTQPLVQEVAGAGLQRVIVRLSVCVCLCVSVCMCRYVADVAQLRLLLRLPAHSGPTRLLILATSVLRAQLLLCTIHEITTTSGICPHRRYHPLMTSL